MRRFNIMRKSALAIVLVLYSFLCVPLCWSEEIHVLSQGVQEFAIDKGIFKTLVNENRDITAPVERIVFYLNMLSFADVVALKRAQLINRDTNPGDFDLAFSLVCLLPFGPIHAKQKPDIIPLRPKIVKTAFISEAKRNKIRQSINKDLIVLGKGQLITDKLGLFNILDKQQILK